MAVLEKIIYNFILHWDSLWYCNFINWVNEGGSIVATHCDLDWGL